MGAREGSCKWRRGIYEQVDTLVESHMKLTKKTFVTTSILLGMLRVTLNCLNILGYS